MSFMTTIVKASHGFGQGEIELTQVFEAEDIMSDPDTLAKETGLRKQVEERKKA